MQLLRSVFPIIISFLKLPGKCVYSFLFILFYLYSIYGAPYQQLNVL